MDVREPCSVKIHAGRAMYVHGFRQVRRSSKYGHSDKRDVLHGWMLLTAFGSSHVLQTSHTPSSFFVMHNSGKLCSSIPLNHQNTYASGKYTSVSENQVLP